MNYDVLLVNKALRDGHTIAKKLNRATSSEEIDHLEKEINDYGDFVDAEFGVIDEDDPFQEKNCELSFLLPSNGSNPCSKSPAELQQPFP